MEFLATLFAGLWAGAAIYIAIAEHPSSLKVGVTYATDYFRVMSRRTAPLMMVLSGLSGCAALYIWFVAGGAGWLAGAILMLGMFPFTGLLIVPTNLKLLKVDCDTNPDEALALHTHWSRMHWLRTLLGTPAFLIFLWLAASPPAAAELTLCNNTRTHLRLNADDVTGAQIAPGESKVIARATLHGWIDYGQIARRYELTPELRLQLEQDLPALQAEPDGLIYIVNDSGCPAAELPAQAEGLPLAPVEVTDLT